MAHEPPPQRVEVIVPVRTLLVLLAVGPVWEEVKDFLRTLPALWEDVTQTDVFENVTATAGAGDKVAEGLKDLAAGLPEAASALFGFATPQTDARWRPVVEDAIRAVSSSLLGNIAISIVGDDRGAVVVGARAAVPGRARAHHRPHPAGRRDARRGGADDRRAHRQHRGR